MSDSISKEFVDTPAHENDTDKAAATREYLDQGTRCERDPHGPADVCILDQVKRDRYKHVIRETISDMKESYKDALTQLRFEELIKEDEDLDWVVSLALDLAGAHVLGLALKGLSKAKKSGIEKLVGNMVGAHRNGGTATSLQRQAYNALTNISDDMVESWTKPAFDMGKGSAKKAVKSLTNEDEATTKTMTTSYIDELTTSAEISFSTFRNRASAGDDLQLVIMNEALINAPTDIQTFKDLLSKKLQRFRTSGVSTLGRKEARDTSVSPSQPVIRDTRVVWVIRTDGSKRLYYQSQDGHDDPVVTRIGDPGTGWVPTNKGPKQFGPGDALGAPRLVREVPEEFAQAALDVSRQRWGSDVPTLDFSNKAKRTGADLGIYMFGTDEDSAPRAPQPQPRLTSQPVVDDADRLLVVPAALDHRHLLHQ